MPGTPRHAWPHAFDRPRPFFITRVVTPQLEFGFLTVSYPASGHSLEFDCQGVCFAPSQEPAAQLTKARKLGHWHLSGRSTVRENATGGEFRRGMRASENRTLQQHFDFCADVLMSELGTAVTIPGRHGSKRIPIYRYKITELKLSLSMRVPVSICGHHTSSRFSYCNDYITFKPTHNIHILPF